MFRAYRANPLITATSLMRKWNLHDKKKAKVINNYLSEARHITVKIGQGLNRPNSQHDCRGWAVVPCMLDVANAVSKGWIQTKAKNHYLLWKVVGLGRLEWFHTTSRVNVWIKSPANRGKALELLCRGFAWTELLSKDQEEELLKSFKWKLHHDIWDTGQPLPRMNIDFYKESNGVVLKLGDKTHPNCIEVIAAATDFQERLETGIEDIRKLELAGGISWQNLLQEFYLDRKSTRKLVEAVCQFFESNRAPEIEDRLHSYSQASTRSKRRRKVARKEFHTHSETCKVSEKKWQPSKEMLAELDRVIKESETEGK